MSTIPTADYVMHVFVLEMSLLTIMPVNYLQKNIRKKCFFRGESGFPIIPIPNFGKLEWGAASDGEVWGSRPAMGFP